MDPTVGGVAPSVDMTAGPSGTTSSPAPVLAATPRLGDWFLPFWPIADDRLWSSTRRPQPATGSGHVTMMHTGCAIRRCARGWLPFLRRALGTPADAAAAVSAAAVD